MFPKIIWVILLRKTGITRRIDELGRIVIPKEIRKNLKIRNNDEMEILLNNDTIVLSKFSKIDHDTLINILLSSINKILNKNILISSKDKIINYVLTDNIIINTDLHPNITKIIEKRELYVSSDMNKIVLFDESISYLINPIIINGDLIGSVIIFDNYHIDNNDINISNIIKNFLENYIE